MLHYWMIIPCLVVVLPVCATFYIMRSAERKRVREYVARHVGNEYVPFSDSIDYDVLFAQPNQRLRYAYMGRMLGDELSYRMEVSETDESRASMYLLWNELCCSSKAPPTSMCSDDEYDVPLLVDDSPDSAAREDYLIVDVLLEDN